MLLWKKILYIASTFLGGGKYWGCFSTLAGFIFCTHLPSKLVFQTQTQLNSTFILIFFLYLSHLLRAYGTHGTYNNTSNNEPIRFKPSEFINPHILNRFIRESEAWRMLESNAWRTRWKSNGETA